MKSRVANLRQEFEELRDGVRPFRLALAKLQALEMVRIIEGKV